MWQDICTKGSSEDTHVGPYTGEELSVLSKTFGREKKTLKSHTLGKTQEKQIKIKVF